MTVCAILRYVIIARCGAIYEDATISGMREITNFAHWIKTHRREKSWTQVELANNAGISRTYLSALEGGKVSLPQRSTRLKLHDAFGTDDDELVDLGLLAWNSMGDEYSPFAERVKVAIQKLEDMSVRRSITVKAESAPKSEYSDARRATIIERLNKIDISQGRFVALIGMIYAYDLEDGGAFEDQFFPTTPIDHEVPF